jgi:hypothetical protein
MSVKSRLMDTTLPLAAAADHHFVRSKEEQRIIKEHHDLCKKYFDIWIGHRDAYYNGVWALINETNADKINEEYEKLRNTSLLTYLKIRCDNEIKYNQRFNVFLNVDSPTTFYMTGPDPNFQAYYYKGEGEAKGRFKASKERAIEAINKIKGGTPMTNIADNLVGNPDTDELCYIKKYDYGNLYGPFTKVFKPSISNEDIAKDCKEIEDAFNANKDVFVLGYGSSGAGKTSTLIYNKTLNKEGILLELLKGDMFKGVLNIFVTINELFSITDEEKKTKKLTMQKNEFKNIKFSRVRDTDPFLIANDATGEGVYYENTREILPEPEVDEIKQKARNIAENPKNYTDDKNRAGEWNVEAHCYQRIGEETDKILNDILWIPTKYKWQIVDVGGTKYLTNVDSTDNNKSNGSFINKDRELMHKYQNETIDKRMKAKKEIVDDKGIVLQQKELAGANGQKLINTLPNLIMNAVDDIRMINPTPNNSVSSRSHVLIYIQIRENNDPVGKDEKTLCVGDLAGVENTFACDTQDTQADFLNIEAIDRKTTKPIIKTDAAGNELYEDAEKKIPIYREEPWYTRKIKKFKEIPMPNEESRIIVEKYLKYDSIKKKFFSDLNRQSYYTLKAWMNLAIVNSSVNLNVLKTHFMPTLLADGNGNKSLPEIERIYQDKVKTQLEPQLRSKITFSELNYSKYISNSKTHNAIFEIIDNNEVIFTSSGVEGFCNERKYEGKFINRALKGMSVDLKTIIDKLTDNGLMKGIQLVQGPCFKYHCNKYNAGCFGHLYKPEIAGDEDYIFQDIKANGVKVENLQIVIFGLLNIDAKYNDYVKIPYFSTNNLKMLRDQFITYLYYSKPDLNIEFIREIKNIYDDDANNDYEFKRKTLKFYLKTYELQLRDDYKNIQDAYDNLVNPDQLSNLLSNLQELINKIDQVNSVTVLGTMDYINRLKDNLYTDISCTMVDKDLGDVSTDTLKKPFNYYNFGNVTLFPDDDFMNYRNVITNYRLIDVIDAQLFYIEKNMKGCANETLLAEPSLLPSIDKPDRFTKTSSLDPSLREQTAMVGNPIKIVRAGLFGGDNTKIHSSEKQELINEYNRLKKMYKKMKSNLV